MTEEKLKITRANNLKLYNINKDSALIFCISALLILSVHYDIIKLKKTTTPPLMKGWLL